MTGEDGFESLPTEEEHRRQIDGIVRRAKHAWRWQHNGEEER